MHKINLSFEDFENKLNELEKALFFKIGFIFCYYIKDYKYKKCSHQTTQLRFLSCIATVEALVGNAKKQKIKYGKAKVPVPYVVTFLKNNLSDTEKKNLLKRVNIRKRDKDIKSLFSKLKHFANMRDNFVHRAELIRIGNDPMGAYISKRRVYKGRSAGLVGLNVSLNSFSEMIKTAIVRYLITCRNKRVPCMDHRIIKT